MVTPSMKIPEGWKFGTALETTSAPNAQTPASRPSRSSSSSILPSSQDASSTRSRSRPRSRRSTSLTSPATAPKTSISRRSTSTSSRGWCARLALSTSRATINSYHFLVTLSDQVAHFGLEHHQSSDDRVGEKTFTDDNTFIENGLLLPHEFTHSWNGKYRRPAGLATPNYQEPMKGNLLWVYEGLTEYLGDVLASRCGIWPAAVYRDRLATIAGYLNDLRPGRTWRDLQDTATAAQLLYAAVGGYDNWRRDTDYYDEGELLWLEVDLTIREKTNGKKSLNDFAAAFEGLGGNTSPKVVPYTFEDIVNGLNAVVPNDWATFLRTRLDSNDVHAPEMDGINALSGYKLIYTDKPDYWSQLLESQHNYVDVRYSLGMSVGTDGKVKDVIVGGLADKAGFGPDMQIIAVNGRGFTPLLMRAAIQTCAGQRSGDRVHRREHQLLQDHPH